MPAMHPEAELAGWLAGELRGAGRLRVWSLVVTVLGDVAEPRGGWMEAGELRALLALLDVPPGALRTALSRLARDGWVERARAGRGALYRLSADRQAEFRAAAATVYAAAPLPGPADWQLVATDGGEPPGGLGLAPGLWLIPREATPPPGALAAGPVQLPLPAWAASRVAPAEVAARYAAFSDRIEAALRGRLSGLDAERAMRLRLLTVHHWRRLVLRAPAVPPALAPPGWPEARCRRRMARLYRLLCEATCGAVPAGRFAG